MVNVIYWNAKNVALTMKYTITASTQTVLWHTSDNATGLEIKIHIRLL